MSEPKNEKKSRFQGILLLMLLVVLPLGSWFYLKKGFQYQKDAFAELKDYGTLGSFNVKDQFGRDINSDLLKGKLVLVNYVSETPESTDRLRTVKNLHEQFDDRNDVLFLNIGWGINGLSKVSEQNLLLDTTQVFYLPSKNSTSIFIRKNIKWPLMEAQTNPMDSLAFQDIDPEGLKDFPFFVLINPKGIISNYYPGGEPAKIKRLIEHMAISLPRTPKAKPVVIRKEN